MNEKAPDRNDIGINSSKKNQTEFMSAKAPCGLHQSSPRIMAIVLDTGSAPAMEPGCLKNKKTQALKIELTRLGKSQNND